MKRFHRPFVALLLSFLLLGSQQAALAHLLSHLYGGPASVTQYQNSHGAIDGAAETCTTCIAVAGVGGSAPPSAIAISFAAFTCDNYLLPDIDPVFLRPVVVCRARAPPTVL